MVLQVLNYSSLFIHFPVQNIFIIGKLLQSNGNFKFDRISGLDPAGPLFFNDVPYPFAGWNVTSASRLTSTDAIFVDAIHTDGKPRSYGYIPQVSKLFMT